VGDFVSVLDWLKRHGLPLENAKSCWRLAAAKGRINALNWLRDAMGIVCIAESWIRLRGPGKSVSISGTSSTKLGGAVELVLKQFTVVI
jgi:hypothetical protein